uniref:non-specific serine/threonine protein kinase n=1 Tax=Hedychium coronarium TaxID=71610 RepID=A0A898BDN3_HEDCO|nr:CBL-interacting protein kinase [Hedychium coronarium]
MADHVAGAPPPAKIIFGTYELGRLLGRGASAKVYHARHLPSGHSVAIKVFPKPRRTAAASASSADSFIREISALRRLRHRHILRLREVLASRSTVYLVLDFAKGGQLFSCVEDRGRLPEDLSRRLFRQLISAVAYSHSRGVFHRDLKPENLLLDDAGDLKVSDFGFAALRPSSDRDQLLHTQCGTPAYVSPEILSGKQRDGYDGAKADIWSCGVILFVLNAGYLPFNDPNLISLYRKIYCGHHKLPAGLDADQKAALMRPLAEDSKPHHRRLSGGELNAFDLISFSSGLDLSGFFTEGIPDRERFVVVSAAERMVERVEQVGKGEGLVVRRVGEKGSVVVVEKQNGELVVRVEVHRLLGDTAVVELEKGGAAGSFWNEKLRPTWEATGDSPLASRTRNVTSGPT